MFYSFNSWWWYRQNKQNRKITKFGADKIIINSINFIDKKFIYKSSKIFGSQCIVVGSI